MYTIVHIRILSEKKIDTSVKVKTDTYDMYSLKYTDTIKLQSF